jgi:hypothetical protein
MSDQLDNRFQQRHFTVRGANDKLRNLFLIRGWVLVLISKAAVIDHAG